MKSDAPQPKRYDVVSKDLVENHPSDWMACASLQSTAKIGVIDSDVSTVSAGADKVFHVAEALPWIFHLELQAGHDADLPQRVLVYNVLLRKRHHLPVRSVVFLLKRDADRPELTGVVQHRYPDGSCYLEFNYQIVRVWKTPAEIFLSGGLGTLPLAPLGDVAPEALPELIRRLQDRLIREAPEQSRTLLTATRLLMGMRYPPEQVAKLFEGVSTMIDWSESSTYQELISKGFVMGEAKGEIKRLREDILSICTERFGRPDAGTVAALLAISEIDRLKKMFSQVLKAADWREMMAIR